MNRPPLPCFLQIPGRSQTERLMPYGNALLWAAVIGILGGFIATAYYWILNGGLYIIWDIAHTVLSAILTTSQSGSLALVLLTLTGGILVGMAVKWMRTPGEISAVVNNIHIQNERMDYKQNPSMLINSLLSIILRGAPVRKLHWYSLSVVTAASWERSSGLHDDLIRTFTFCGMAAALGAFFGAPIGRRSLRLKFRLTGTGVLRSAHCLRYFRSHRSHDFSHLYWL